ncbi:MAG TPA: hypothetical protein VJ895_00870, partial [Candidatus Nanoarchaeia archaeon]|nr:hypothetical protein [Candidatus Nanoarchaeia archaeon]
SIYPSKISSGEIVEEEAIMSFYSDDWYVEPVTFTTTYLHGGGTHNLTSFFFDEVNYFVFSVDEVHATHDIYGNAIAQGESYISFDYSYDIGSKGSIAVSRGDDSLDLKSGIISPKEIESESEFSCDSGCLFENNCVPVGYRIEGKYCHINKEMVEQKISDESCENNFECDSNLCVDGNCVSGSLWQRILSWFNKFSR